MASSKEIQQSSRPLAHRPSMSTTSSGISSRQSHSRTNSHSLLAGPGPNNGNNRVTRRKSMTSSSGANMAAVAAALKEGGSSGGGGGSSNGTAPMPIAGGATGHRRHASSRSVTGRSAMAAASLPSPPASLPASRFIMAEVMKGSEIPEHAIDDDAIEMSAEEGDGSTLDPEKSRVRRASDGSPLTKDGKKSNRAELRCEKCGKGYKHSSCLTKHLWEHTPEWSLTSKLLISKHQQVQLLEAASVLVAMNVDPPKDSTTTPPDSAKDFPSDNESASPAASGYSEQHDRQSSADTTPPPQLESLGGHTIQYRQTTAKRYSSSGSGFSRSYQSTPSLFAAGSAPNGSGFGGHMRRQSHHDRRRPLSSGLNATGQEDRDLAAALLSCSFGSNGGGSTVILPADAPPVPPLPAQYLGQAASFSSTGFINSFPSRQPESFTRGTRRAEDVKMEDSAESSLDDDDDDMTSKARNDDDVGVFGDMVL